jgi:hypothetical protein
MQPRQIKIYKFQSLGNNMPLGEKKVQNQTHIIKENKDKHMPWTVEQPGWTTKKLRPRPNSYLAKKKTV